MEQFGLSPGSVLCADTIPSNSINGLLNTYHILGDCVDDGNMENDTYSPCLHGT